MALSARKTRSWRLPKPQAEMCVLIVTGALCSQSSDDHLGRLVSRGTVCAAAGVTGVLGGSCADLHWCGHH